MWVSGSVLHGCCVVGAKRKVKTPKHQHPKAERNLLDLAATQDFFYTWGAPGAQVCH